MFNQLFIFDFYSLKNIIAQNIDIKQKLHIIFSVIVAVPSCCICLSDNIPPPLTKFWKGMEFSDIHHVTTRKDLAEITVVPVKMNQTPSIRSQITEYSGH